MKSKRADSIMEDQVSDDVASQAAAMKQSYLQVIEHWAESDSRKQLVKIMQRHRPVDGWQINQAVIFGTGHLHTFEATNNQVPHSWKQIPDLNMLQLAIFLDMVQIMTNDMQSTGHKDFTIDIYAQDPLYDDIDVQILEDLNCTAIEHGEGVEIMCRETFGFTAGHVNDMEIMDQCAHLQPRIWVGHRLDVVEGQTRWMNWVGLKEGLEKHACYEQIMEGIREWGMMKDEQEERVEELWKFAESHVMEGFPAAKGYDHAIQAIWFETEGRRAEMEKLLSGQGCEDCVDGKRRRVLKAEPED